MIIIMVIIIIIFLPHLAGLAAQSLRLPPESQEVGGGALPAQHGGAVCVVTLQLRPQVAQTGQVALQGVGLRGQGVCVTSNRSKGVQLIIQVGNAREDVTHVRLDLTHALQSGLQGGAALLDLME